MVMSQTGESADCIFHKIIAVTRRGDGIDQHIDASCLAQSHFVGRIVGGQVAKDAGSEHGYVGERCLALLNHLDLFVEESNENVKQFAQVPLEERNNNTSGYNINHPYQVLLYCCIREISQGANTLGPHRRRGHLLKHGSNGLNALRFDNHKLVFGTHSKD